MEASVRMLSPVERVFYLKSVDALRELSPTELAPMAQRCHERFFPKGAAVLTAGQRVDAFHVIVEGRIEVRGGEYGQATLGSEHALGMLSLLSRREDGLEAVALEDTTTLEISGDDLYDVFEDNFSLVHQQIRAIAGETMAERQQIPDGTYLAPGENIIVDTSRPLDLIQRLLLMRRGATFRKANMDAMIDLARQGVEVRCDAGETLWLPGEPSGFMFQIVSGTIRATLPDGDRYFRAGPGYPIGNVESMARQPRWYKAVTETSIVLIRAETDHFFDVLEDHFAMAIEFLAMTTTGLIGVRAELRAAALESGDSTDADGGDIPGNKPAS